MRDLSTELMISHETLYEISCKFIKLNFLPVKPKIFCFASFEQELTDYLTDLDNYNILKLFPALKKP